MRFGFDVSQAWQHDPAALAERLYEIGYRAIVIRLHPRYFHPARQSPETLRLIDQLHQLTATPQAESLELILETASPHLLELDSASELAIDGHSERVVGMLLATLELAAKIPGTTVCIRTAPSRDDHAAALDRITPHLERLLAAASRLRVGLALQTGAGRIIDSIGRFERLLQWLPSENALKLAADVGEMARGGELPVAPLLSRQLDRLSVVSVNGMQLARPSAESASVDVAAVVASLHQMGFARTLVARIAASERAVTTADLRCIYAALQRGID